MFDQVVTIANLIVDSFLHVWPYLLVTIPLAVAVQMSGISRYINRAFQARPIAAIFLATAVGAFSPFCSCGVVPVVAALLIGGVPLAPVMSFWIASPSMDPEIFFLSVATLGWELAVSRLAATLVLSLGAGLATHWIVQRGMLGQQILRTRRTNSPASTWALLKAGWQRFKRYLTILVTPSLALGSAPLAPGVVRCCPANLNLTNEQSSTTLVGSGAFTPAASCGSTAGCGCSAESAPFLHRLLRETWSATLMVVKFMALAFFLSALIKLYVPTEWVVGLLGGQRLWSIITAAVLGVPAYASNLTALPMVSGLLDQGMNPSAALAFLISGPTTTLPAMAAVWGLASRRVFVLYVSFSLLGAIVLGCLHNLVTAMF